MGGPGGSPPEITPGPSHFSVLITVFVIHHSGKAHLLAVKAMQATEGDLSFFFSVA